MPIVWVFKNCGKQTKKLNFYSDVCRYTKNQFKSDGLTVKAVNRLYPGHVSRMVLKLQRIFEITGPTDEESPDLNSHETILNTTECKSISRYNKLSRET